MIEFDQFELFAEFDTGAISRGKDYFAKGRVVSHSSRFNQTDKYLAIKSLVRGTNLYSQKIEVDRDEDGISFHGICTCPVGFDCKHVVAALFAHLNQSPKLVKSQVTPNYTLQTQRLTDAWLDDFSQLFQPPEDSLIQDDSHWLAYLLQGLKPDDRLGVSIARSGFKKNGGYKTPRNVSIQSEIHCVRAGHHYRHVNPVDGEIFAELQGAQSRYFQDIRVSGAAGWQVLKRMLASGRCFWRTIEAGPLSLGETLPLQFHWESNAGGKRAKTAQQILKSSLDPSWHLLPTDPVSYYNPQDNQIGLLDSTLNFHQVLRLLAMPALGKKEARQLSMTMLQAKLETLFPTPVQVKVEEVGTAQLTPVARLGRFRTDIDNHTQAIEVCFRYAKGDIKLSDPTVFTQESDLTVYRITRDPLAEAKILGELERLGFVPTTTKPGRHQEEQPIFVAPQDQKAMAQLTLWRHFLQEGKKQLHDQGWQVEMSSNFDLSFIEPQHQWNAEIDSQNDWFSLRFDLKLDSKGGRNLPLLPVVSQLLADYTITELPDEILVPIASGEILQIQKSRLMPILTLLYELYNSVSLGQESVSISRFDALKLHELGANEAMNLKWSGGQALRKLGKKLADFSGVKPVTPAKTFRGQLRDYQQHGFNWLQFLREYEIGGILADDMGLGKTVQTLVHLQKEKSARRMKTPCLIVAPTSLMSNWKREAARFTPNLKVLVLQGNDRKQHFDQLADYDLILSTYPLIPRDFEQLVKIHYHVIVLDEAQNIKNPKAIATLCLKKLNTKYRLALTGTPMENHLGELWSIFDFLMPGFLGSETAFRRKYRTPIEKDQDGQVSDLLRRRVKPFLMRRSKQLVANELPPKTEIIKTVSFDNSQATLYESIRIAMEEKIRLALSSKGLNRSHITILDALLKLRQVCCDPQLLKLTQAKKVKKSAKLDLLMTMLPEMLDEGRKVLIFSQFTSMLSLIEAQLNLYQIDYCKLTGSTKNRDAVINRFTQGEVSVFLISLKAGGVGLNLTEADTVIHYDPWWNPAVENQASDRAHRIGQDKPVFIYKLVVENTLEEKILQMQARKQALADGVYASQDSSKSFSLSAEDIEELLAPQ